MALSADYPHQRDPLTARNQFLGGRPAAVDIISFNKAKDLLPEPVLPEREGWTEMYWRAWELLWLRLRRPRHKSGHIANYLGAAADDRLGMWESAFGVQFGLYGRQAFNFMGTLDNFYARQHPDGFICREIDADGSEGFPPFDPNSAGPNILAWAEWRYYRGTGDDSRLPAVFWPLMAYHHWLRRHRTWPSKLYWTTGLAGSMCNQSRIPESEAYHQHWTWVDANMQAALNCYFLGQIAQLIQQTELAEELAAERAFLIREINDRLWSATARFYLDADPYGDWSAVKSVAAYWGLLDRDLVPANRLNPFLQHLREPTAFNRPHRVPSQSADSAGYDAENGDQWRGGVWAPTNYMVVKGLRCHKQDALAHAIALNHLENLLEVFRRTDTLWENYAPEHAAPGSLAAPNHAAWAGLSAIAILLEDVIGLQVDWPLKRITWDRRLECAAPYGVRNLPLGAQGTVDLIGDDQRLQVRSDHPFTLTVVHSEGQMQTGVPAGRSDIAL